MDRPEYKLEYRGFRAFFEDEPTEEHLQQTRDLIDRNCGNPRFVASMPLDQWAEDPTLPDPMGQAVMVVPIT